MSTLWTRRNIHRAGGFASLLHGACACCSSFKLTNCANPADMIYTTTDLSAYVGQVVLIGETCYEVEEGSGSPAETVVVVNNYATCALCGVPPTPVDRVCGCCLPALANGVMLVDYSATPTTTSDRCNCNDPTVISGSNVVLTYLTSYSSLGTNHVWRSAVLPLQNCPGTGLGTLPFPEDNRSWVGVVVYAYIRCDSGELQKTGSGLNIQLVEAGHEDTDNNFQSPGHSVWNEQGSVSGTLDCCGMSGVGAGNICQYSAVSFTATFPNNGCWNGSECELGDPDCETGECNVAP